MRDGTYTSTTFRPFLSFCLHQILPDIDVTNTSWKEMYDIYKKKSDNSQGHILALFNRLQSYNVKGSIIDIFGDLIYEL